MARLPRVLYQLFGADGPNDDFGQFGSKTAGSPVKTKSISVIQSLAAWATGFKAALVSGNRQPYLEDMNAAQYVHGYMMAYLMQEGVPEYDGSTTYHQYSIVKKPGTFELYGSKINDNLANALPSQTDDTNWQFLFPVRTTGLIGQVTDAQVAAMAASKLTGQVADSQIAAMAASKLTGTVADAQIAGMGVSKLIGDVNNIVYSQSFDPTVTAPTSILTSASLTATGGKKVVVFANMEADIVANNPLGYFFICHVRRDGVVIGKRPFAGPYGPVIVSPSFVIVDEPPAGAHTYDIGYRLYVGTLRNFLGYGLVVTELEK